MKHPIFYDQLPPLSLDPVAEQVNCNSQSLKNLACLVERLENKLPSFLDSNTSSATGSIQQSYATVASSVPPPQVSPPTSMSVQKSTTSRSSTSDWRESNLILFGLPEEGSIVEAQKV